MHCFQLDVLYRYGHVGMTTLTVRVHDMGRLLTIAFITEDIHDHLYTNWKQCFVGRSKWLLWDIYSSYPSLFFQNLVSSFLVEMDFFVRCIVQLMVMFPFSIGYQKAGKITIFTFFLTHWAVQYSTFWLISYHYGFKDTKYNKSAPQSTNAKYFHLTPVTCRTGDILQESSISGLSISMLKGCIYTCHNVWYGNVLPLVIKSIDCMLICSCFFLFVCLFFKANESTLRVLCSQIVVCIRISCLY